MKLHFHDWNKWSDPINTYNTGHKQQWTVCNVCNKAKFRTLWWDSQSALSNILEALKKAQSNCNGFCGEYECKENQENCKRKAQEK